MKREFFFYINIAEEFVKNSSLNKITQPDKILQNIFLVFISIYLVALIFLVADNTVDTYDSDDEKYVHYPAITEFMETFPSINFKNYTIPMTPFYHMGMALAGKIISSDIVFLRYLNLFLSLGCLFFIYRFYLHISSGRNLFYFLALLALSPYFIGSAIRLATDNTALLFCTVTLLSIKFSKANNSFNHKILSNILILITVSVRQIYAWLIGFYLLYYFRKFINGSLKEKINIIAPVILPVAALLFFFIMWGSFGTSKASRVEIETINFQSFIFIVCLIGFFNIFFSLWVKEMFDKINFKTIIIISGAALTVIVFLIYPVDIFYHTGFAGRRGGYLWLLATYFPALIGTSILFWVLFCWGIISTLIIGQYFYQKKQYWVILLFALWFFAVLFYPPTFQKYFEPFIIFLLGIVFSTSSDSKYIYWIGPVILLTGYIAADIYRFFL